MEWEDGNEYPVIRLDVSLIHTHSTQDVKNSLRMVVWNVSTKVWSQIKQQLIIESLNCLPNLFYIEMRRQFLNLSSI